MRAMGAQWARGMEHPSRIDSPVFEAILAMIERSSPERFEAQIRALLNRSEAGPLLPTIACDTLLLCGSDDLWRPLVRRQQMQALIPEASSGVIAASGHMSNMERPQAVTQALLAWLARPATGLRPAGPQRQSGSGLSGSGRR